MTTPFLVSDLQLFEGAPGTHDPELTAYQDTGGVWTIGWGHTGPEVVQGLTWSFAQCLTALNADIAIATGSLDLWLPWWRTLNDARQDGLANMAFNMGLHRLMGFHLMLAALQAGDWQAANDNALDSKWDTQVGPTRANFVANLFLTGVRPAA